MARATRTTGHSGPPPKPEARRRNKRAVETLTIDFEKMSTDTVEVPAPNESWAGPAYDLYMALTESFVARIYEPSDWMTAWMLCEDYSRELKPRKVQVGLDGNGEPILVEMEMPMPGAKMTAILKGLSALIATEGDRRRLLIDVKRNGQLQHGKETKTVQQRVTQNRLAILKGGKTA